MLKEFSTNVLLVLEPAWLVVQIVAVLWGAYWSYKIWIRKDRNALKPAVVASVSGYKICEDVATANAYSISFLWKLKNPSSFPVVVKGVEAEVFSVENTVTYVGKDVIVDRSAVALERLSHGKISLSPSSGIIAPGSEISRDVSVLFVPSNKDEIFDKSWVQRNRFSVDITATANNAELTDLRMKTRFTTSLSYISDHVSP